MGLHSKPGWFARVWRKLTNQSTSEETSNQPIFERKFRQQPVRMVDGETKDIHLLEFDFVQLPDDSYTALCGTNFWPAFMVEPGDKPCEHCFAISDRRGYR